MYGENEVNEYHLLKYSLLYDFFQYFSSIKIYGIPIAQCLAGKFLVYIQPFVDQNHLNHNLISALRKERIFQTMGDINKELISFDKISPVTIQKNKKSILLSEGYYDFSVDQLREYEVTLYGVRHKECHSLLPKQFKKYVFRDELIKMKNEMINQEKEMLKRQVDDTLKSNPLPGYFSTPLFKQWFIKESMNVIKWVYILEQLILKSKPSVIIVTEEASIFGAILGLLSQKYQIPLINMPIVLIGDRSIIPSRADYYFVWGRNQKNWFIKRKTEPDKITETGNVKFYYEMNYSNSSKEYFRNKLNIPSNHHIIGFTSQPFSNTNDRLEEWIESIPNNLPITILVKKHRSDLYEYPLLIKKKNVKILSNDYPLYEFLSHIDYLMTISSTTAIEAILLNKPLLILQPNIPYHYHFSSNQINAHLAKAQAGEVIKNAIDLVQAIKKITINPNYVDHLKNKGNKFLSETLITIDQAPILAKNKIEEIILKHL
ncbi:hypothetical protein [Peribacillus frigoritolerans]|uniref:capsular polysaccharide export protein, LipB/KpsS family n=1 Tax=Peribacillus frigoritolerans TaxID=450367 RepID=UPI002E1EBD2F|nr:hypothetical protein [Peribacillus frigoritolerans]MED3848249.1 hypothetical protein [Peribacillus frigoritolerans]